MKTRVSHWPGWTSASAGVTALDLGAVFRPVIPAKAGIHEFSLRLVSHAAAHGRPEQPPLAVILQGSNGGAQPPRGGVGIAGRLACHSSLVTALNRLLIRAMPATENNRMQLRPVTMSLKKASMLRGNNFMKSGDKRQQAIERTTNAVVPAPDTKTIPTSRFQCRNRLRAKPITNATTPGDAKAPHNRILEPERRLVAGG